MSEQEQNVVSEDEISLKDLITKFWEYFWYILKSWKLLSLFVILGLGFNLYKYFTHKTSHTATISFMINEDESSSLGGLSGLLGSFGGLLGGGASEYNLDKILEISKSYKIGEKILLKKTIINGKEDYVGNHLIVSLDTMNMWENVRWYKKPFTNIEKKLEQRSYRFTKDSIDFNNIIETYVVKELIKKLFGSNGGSGIVTSEYGELTGIMKLSTSSYNPILSINITNSLYEELSDFYIKKSVEKQQQTFDLMKVKHDSINDLLRTIEYSLAKFQDTNQGLFKVRDQVKKDQYQRDVFIMATALGEAKKNLEIADFSLRSKTPFISVLDKPYLPLENSSTGIFSILVLGSILGGFLGVIFIFLKKLYADIISK